MAEEIKPQEKETLAPPSEENKPEVKPEEAKPQENIDYTAKLNELAESIDKKFNQFGFNLRKVQERLEQEGIKIEEEPENLNSSKVKEIVADVVKDQLAGFQKDFAEQQKLTSEALRALASKPGKGEGDAGQEKPQKGEAPKLSPADQKIVDKYGLVWDSEAIDQETGKKGSWIAPKK